MSLSQDTHGHGHDVTRPSGLNGFLRHGLVGRREHAATDWPSMRSSQSLRLEGMVRRSQGPGLMMQIGDFPCNQTSALSNWIAVVRPDSRRRRLTITHAGAGLSAMQANPLTGTDYLDLVDPAYKGEAFDSVIIMLTRPCGLWQLSPVRLADGDADMFEFTGLPVFDAAAGCGAVMFLIWHPSQDFRGVTSVGHARAWSWLELRQGAPG